MGVTCDAKIRPFPVGNQTEIHCEQERWPHDGEHSGVLRDYAHPGSETVISWDEQDRRNFRGEWADCPLFPGCILPASHRGKHAV